MANYRQIHVSIWKDEWFLDLEPQEKLLFIYLFSNENTSLAGIYKLPIKVIAFETGLDQQYILDTLSKFHDKDKVHYQDGIVWVVHMRRYHETKSEKVQVRIQSDIDLIPDCELKIRYLYGMDTSPQLKEEEDEKEEEEYTINPAASTSFDPPAVRVFQDVTGLTAIPGKTITEDTHRIRALMSKHKDQIIPYLSQFWEEWTRRKYSRANTGWLDWAIAGEIPKQKTAPNQNDDWTTKYSTVDL